MIECLVSRVQGFDYRHVGVVPGLAERETNSEAKVDVVPGTLVVIADKFALEYCHDLSD